jgi:hypothetical protein
MPAVKFSAGTCDTLCDSTVAARLDAEGWPHASDLALRRPASPVPYTSCSGKRCRKRLPTQRTASWSDSVRQASAFVTAQISPSLAWLTTE